MADSVREKIMQHIQDTLEWITMENGYTNTLRSVQRFQQQGQELKDVPMAVLVEGGDAVEGDGPLAGASSLLSRSMTLSVVLIQRQDVETDSRSASEVMNTLIADVQRAMQLDPSRGELAIDTKESGISELDVEEGQPELVQTIGYQIHYRHRRDDPTVKG